MVRIERKTLILINHDKLFLPIDLNNGPLLFVYSVLRASCFDEFEFNCSKEAMRFRATSNVNNSSYWQPYHGINFVFFFRVDLLRVEFYFSFSYDFQPIKLTVSLAYNVYRAICHQFIGCIVNSNDTFSMSATHLLALIDEIFLFTPL